MDILFVTAADKIKLNSISNGTMLLSTILLQSGFDVDILRFCQFKNYTVDYKLFIEEISNEIVRINPKAVSFYTLWTHYHIILRIAKEVKAKNKDIITVLGGPHSSATAAETMHGCEYIDFICIGEGEKTVTPFFSAIIQNERRDLATIPGLYYRQNGSVLHNDSPIPLSDLDTLPYWDPVLIKACDPKNDADIHSPTYYMPIDTGRGCPFSCTYCATSNFWRRTYRLKSPDRIVAELKHYYLTYGIRSFFFSHDAFTVNKALVSEICKRIKDESLDIVWKCTTRVDCISEQLIQEMKEAGLQAIEMGIETGSPRMQKIINKKLDLSNAKKTIKYLIDNQIKTSVFFIYGFPEENEEDLNQTLNFLFDCIDLGTTYTSFNFCLFSPGTKLTKQYYDSLILDQDYQFLFHRTFGISEEMDSIIANKQLFSNYYTLDTPLRRKYQYLYFLQLLYRRQPILMQFVRSYYGQDTLKLFNDFISTNECLFIQLDDIYDAIKNNATQIIWNISEGMDNDSRRYIQELIDFHNDIKDVKSSESGTVLRKVYQFNYLDYLEKQSIKNFSNIKSELLIQKCAGKIQIQLVDFPI